VGRRWLIDGNNVMGSRPDGWWRDRSGAKTRLVADVERWARLSGRQVLVFFDGHPDDRVLAVGPTVEVRFAGSGRRDAADDAIVAEATADDRVVTADRGLVGRLPVGVEIVGPRRLLAALDEPADDIDRIE
jgi:hypothetical protein